MSPRTSKQFEEIRGQSRKKILDAAFELFAIQGYHGTSISQIAKHAGVAKGLIYNYFEKKDDLVLAVVQDMLSEQDEIVAEMLAIEDPKAQLRWVIGFSFDYMTKQSRKFRLLTSLALKLDQFAGVQEIVSEKYRSVIPLMAHLLEKAGIPDYEQEARLLAAVMDGVGIQYLTLGETFPMEEIKNYLIQKYCT